MNQEGLKKLCILNQLCLSEEQENEVLSFFENRGKEELMLREIDTENVTRMVHVNPIMTVVREDVVKKDFSRTQLQKDAPETDEGYWCVPQVLN